MKGQLVNPHFYQKQLGATISQKQQFAKKHSKIKQGLFRKKRLKLEGEEGQVNRRRKLQSKFPKPCCDVKLRLAFVNNASFVL